MTNEQAIKVLLDEWKCIDRNDGINCDRQCEKCDLVMDSAILKDAYNMAIKALEQEPTKEEWAILQKWRDNRGISIKDFEDAMNALQEPCTDAVSREDVSKTMCEFCPVYNCTSKCLSYKHMIELPSVTQKSGKWIKIQSGDKDFPESIVCSMCGNENSHLDFNENAEPIGKVFVTSKYCPNCGAKMESEG